MTKGIALKPFFLDSAVFFTLKNTKECISIAVLDFNKIHQIIDVIQNTGVTSVNIKKEKKIKHHKFLFMYIILYILQWVHEDNSIGNFKKPI